MSLMDLMCPFQLSDHAFITYMSLCLGVPVPHTRILKESEEYAQIDVWADFFLTDSAHASRLWHTLHSSLVFFCPILPPVLDSLPQPSSLTYQLQDTYHSGDIFPNSINH